MNRQKAPELEADDAASQPRTDDLSQRIGRKANQTAPEKQIGSDSFAIVREDKAPREWNDAYYNGSVAQTMAKWWTRELGVQCFCMVAEYPQLKSGYHAEQAETTTKSRTPQARLGVKRRLVGGHWTAASPNTAMAAALIRAARPRKQDPDQLLLSDFGVMPDPHKKSEDD
jgi:hypothetical protein